MAEQDQDKKPTATAGVDWLELVFLGVHGYVVGVHRFSGSEVWRTSLAGAGYNLITLLVEDGVLYAASHGYLYALNPASGEVFWRNDLKGLGHHLISMATARSHTETSANPVLLARARQAAQQAAAGAGTIPGT